MSVYILTTRADRFVAKIGFSASDPRRRMKQIQTSCPFELQLAAVIPGDERLERKLHQTFASSRLRGEWFAGEHKLRDFIYYLWSYGDQHDRKITREEFQTSVQDCIINDQKFYPCDTPDEVYAASADASLWMATA